MVTSKMKKHEGQTIAAKVVKKIDGRGRRDQATDFEDEASICCTSPSKASMK